MDECTCSHAEVHFRVKDPAPPQRGPGQSKFADEYDESGWSWFSGKLEKPKAGADSAGNFQVALNISAI